MVGCIKHVYRFLVFIPTTNHYISNYKDGVGVSNMYISFLY